jgi:hypothetical protein
VKKNYLLTLCLWHLVGVVVFCFVLSEHVRTRRQGMHAFRGFSVSRQIKMGANLKTPLQGNGFIQMIDVEEKNQSVSKKGCPSLPSKAYR